MARTAERADSGRGRVGGRHGDDDRCGDEVEERINGNKTLSSDSASAEEPNTPESESDIITYSAGGGARE